MGIASTLALGAAMACVAALLLVIRGITAGIAAHHRPEAILFCDELASSLGVESKGVWQGRGNGGLVLTRDELHFLPVVGAVGVRVPLSAVRAVSVVRSHLGKWLGRPLLQVEYDEAGRADSVAFFVRDLPAWQQHLATALPSSPLRR